MTKSLEFLLQQRFNKNGFMDLPVVSHVEENLYVGASPVYWEGGHEHFQTIFNFYPWEDYALVPPQIRYDFKLQDSHEVPEDWTLRNYANQINQACEEGLTLVHCQMGINRSNLFAARALMLKGRTAAQAIELLRKQRSEYVLMNRSFRKFLVDLEA